MSVLVVLHEASRTGAPRVGGLVAAALQRYDDVRVLCLAPGPLLGWLEERVGAANVRCFADVGPRHRIPFAERLAAAEAVLDAEPADLILVNSLAAGEFVVAAKAAGRAAILYLHEKAAEMRKLLAIDLAKFEMIAMLDAVILAAADLRRDLVEVFGFVPEQAFDFGVAVDAEEVDRLSRVGDAVARNAAGAALEWSDRLRVGMCGHASARKGADIFFAAAAALPEHDFLWIGNWDETEAPDNPALAAWRAERLPNLYVTGGVDNPYRHLGRLDLFFLSSREDPNALVLGEALLLRVPILAFTATTAVTDFLGRVAIMCHGTTNLADAVRVLRTLDAAELRAPEFRRLVDPFRSRYDIAEKIGGLVAFLAAVPPQ